jgi:hypothetical protein
MDTVPSSLLSDLPREVAICLNDFVTAASAALGKDLVAIVLYGSAAEGRMRATSDVNVVIVLQRFDASALAALQGPLRIAHAAIELKAMFLCADEIQAASEAFAVKFDDILHRHRVLYGANPLTGLTISRAAQVRRLRQVLLNLVLRLRHDFVLISGRAEQAERAVADAIGPLRAAAATLGSLAGHSHANPKAALAALVAAQGSEAQSTLLETLSNVREGGHASDAATTLVSVIELTEMLHRLALATSEA